MNNNKTKLTSSLAIALLATIIQTSQGQTTTPITGWGSETGQQNGSPVSTDDGLGNFSLTGANLTGNDAPRALFSTLTLVNVGDSITLSGSFTFTAGIVNNQQFRFGLFNNNGNATGTLSGGLWSGATTSGWLGYFIAPGEITGGGSATTRVFGRSGSGSNFELSGTGAGYDVAGTPGPNDSVNASITAGTYAISLSITKESTGVQLSYNFQQTVGGTFQDTGTYLDASGASSTEMSYDAAAFLLSNTTGNGTTPFTFNNVDVTFTPAPVPEPATLSMMGLGFSLLIGIMRKRNA
jgi:PEP-CTERM motif-containing protein